MNLRALGMSLSVALSITTPAMADSGMSEGFKIAMRVTGSSSLTLNAASCQAKGLRLTIYTSDEFHPGLATDRFVWTNDWPAIALLSQVCRHGGMFNLYTKDGNRWEAWVWPQ